MILSIKWNESTPEQRNAACAQFMPPSEVNPIVSWWLYCDGKAGYQLRVLTKQEAEDGLRMIKASPETWADCTGFPEPYRAGAEIREIHRHVRYSDTPGGAWMLIEQLNVKGWTASIVQIPNNCGITLQRVGNPAVHTAGTFCEAAAMAFLKANGVVIL
jgi:hypothetical protein